MAAPLRLRGPFRGEGFGWDDSGYLNSDPLNRDPGVGRYYQA